MIAALLGLTLTLTSVHDNHRAHRAQGISFGIGLGNPYYSPYAPPYVAPVAPVNPYYGYGYNPYAYNPYYGYNPYPYYGGGWINYGGGNYYHPHYGWHRR